MSFFLLLPTGSHTGNHPGQKDGNQILKIVYAGGVAQGESANLAYTMP